MGPSSAQKYAKNTAAESNNTALTSSNQGGQLFSGAFPAFEEALKYFGRLGSGNPNAVNEAVQPQVDTINQQYDAATQAAGRNTRRGGAQADLTTALGLQRTGQIAGAKAAAVAGAPSAEASLGETGTQLSQAAILNALNAFATSGNLDLGLMGTEQAQAANTASALTPIISGALSLFGV